MAAIYQWFVGGELLLTTKPYPYEFEEPLQTELQGPVQITYRQWPIDTNEFTSGELVGAELIPIRIDMPNPVDTNEFTSASVTAELVDIRLDIPAPVDTNEFTMAELRDAEVLDILIRAQGRDADLETSIAVEEITYVQNP